MVGQRNVDMVLRQRGKRHLAKVERWGTDALERIGAKCHLISNANSVRDWEIFLNSIYESVTTLTSLQRTILLLSQEFGIPRREVARIIDADPSVVHVQYNLAVSKVARFMQQRNLLKPLQSYEELTPLRVREYGGKNVINCLQDPAAAAAISDEELSAQWQSARSGLVHAPKGERCSVWRRVYIYHAGEVLKERTV